MVNFGWSFGRYSIIDISLHFYLSNALKIISSLNRNLKLKHKRTGNSGLKILGFFLSSIKYLRSALKTEVGSGNQKHTLDSFGLAWYDNLLWCTMALNSRPNYWGHIAYSFVVDPKFKCSNDSAIVNNKRHKIRCQVFGVEGIVCNKILWQRGDDGEKFNPGNHENINIECRVGSS